jgi:urocanate hydratase
MNQKDTTLSTYAVLNSTLTIDDIIKAFEEAKKELSTFEKISTGDWMLISPTGVIHKGTIQQLLNELMRHHPMFKGMMKGD